MSTINCEVPSFILRVTVTQKHISCGKPRSVSACPVAIAILEALPVMDHDGEQFLSVQANDVDIPVTVPGVGWALHWYRHFKGELPKAAQKFIGDFDTGNSPKPFEFNLTLTQEGPYA